MHKTLLLITGPTAIGKTAMAIKIAQHFNTEIISTDSRQFYREMNIGTAKPTATELAAVKHHFINNRSMHELYSAGEFEREALATLDALFSTRDIVVAVGGSGLYAKALCEGLDDMPAADLAFRDSLTTLYETGGLEALQQVLMDTAAHRWETIDKKNPQRIMRAIEMSRQQVSTGAKKVRNFKIIKAGLTMNRDLLYNRINTRVEMMMQDGLEAEARTLYPFRALNALQTVGYTELFDYFDGKTSLDKAIEMVKQHTRNFAKRQLTWFRRETGITWFEPAQEAHITALVKAAMM